MGVLAAPAREDATDCNLKGVASGGDFWVPAWIPMTELG
ncbi:unnamed protein product [Spirodela intermedia]|uniref:Uncharacterized protein n=2 Tax=Spirodela intermedia TaxID=51605 RepID=A0A7I8JSG7_SPIIN|nr:unnamed protein product [Spirodela intermedia]CAA6672705.1 unnamed protein product [Spirodela intermedia]CAA7409930.1 unnamed protein product [Spirodela intermedia]